MRITQESLVGSTLDRLRSRLARLSDSQAELSSGRRILKPSDDPGSMSSLLSLRSTLRARQQQQRNAEDGRAWTDMADGRLQDGLSLMQRARELAIRAGGTITPSERAAISAEILSLRDSLAGIANATHQGRGVFAGSAAGDAIAVTAGIWSYTGDATPMTRRIGDGEVVAVSVTADRVFGFAAGENTFAVLEELAAAVGATDTAGVNTGIDAVDRGMRRMTDALTEIGAAGAAIDRAVQRTGAEQIAIRRQISAVEDVDMAEAVMEMQLQEVAYQATLSTMARTLQPSLADFLR